MFSRSRHHLGDTWYQVHAGRVHMFHLVCPETVDRHTLWSIGHASSDDLMEWELHPDILHSDQEDPRLSCLSTGSVISWRGRFIMALVGNHNSPCPRVIFLESKDLYDWRILEDAGFGIDGIRYTKRRSLRFQNPRWRDPFLFMEGGWLNCLMTAAVEKAPLECDGVVGVVRTRNLSDWEYLPPLRTPFLGTDLECPKLYVVDGRYHLLVSLFDVLQAPDFARIQPSKLNTSTTFSLVADSFEGPYSFTGDARVLDQDVEGFPYACEAIQWNGRWYFLGTCWSDRKGDSICDPVPLNIHPSGIRRLSPV